MDYKKVKGYEKLTQSSLYLHTDDLDYIYAYNIKIQNYCIANEEVKNAFALKFKLSSMARGARKNEMSIEMQERLKRFIIICMTIELNEACEDTIYSSRFYELVEQITNNFKEDQKGLPLTREELNKEYTITLEEILHTKKGNK